ncbi:MAG: endonuclease/exonuclease/phosphatase family protein [Clostridia bacterium]|nr:endonuclease/exonuclease/phosphatase family protein [Clostridia bacterium]
MSVIIRVMTSNVWGNCPASAPIANRDDNLAVVYRRYAPHVIGMQEVSPKSRAESDNIISLVRAMYREVPADITPFQNNYTPILYRYDVLSLDDMGYINYKSLNDAGSKSITWGLFRENSSGTRFLHINTHYYWTDDAPGRTARIQNSLEMLALVNKLAAQYPDIPMFFTGDFNCRTQDVPIRILMDEGIHEARSQNEGTPPLICSHHGYPGKNEETGLFDIPAAVKEGPENSIDHILVRYGNTQVHVRSHVIVDDRESLLATDHCPIYCDMEF